MVLSTAGVQQRALHTPSSVPKTQRISRGPNIRLLVFHPVLTSEPLARVRDQLRGAYSIEPRHAQRVCGPHV